MGRRRGGRASGGDNDIADPSAQSSLGGPAHLRGRSDAGGGIFEGSLGVFLARGTGRLWNSNGTGAVARGGGPRIRQAAAGRSVMRRCPSCRDVAVTLPLRLSYGDL